MVNAKRARGAYDFDDLIIKTAELLQENGYGQFEGLIPALAPLLGEAGLLQLEEALRERAQLPPPGSLSLRRNMTRRIPRSTSRPTMAP